MAELKNHFFSVILRSYTEMKFDFEHNNDKINIVTGNLEDAEDSEELAELEEFIQVIQNIDEGGDGAESDSDQEPVTTSYSYGPIVLSDTQDTVRTVSRYIIEEIMHMLISEIYSYNIPTVGEIIMPFSYEMMQRFFLRFTNTSAIEFGDQNTISNITILDNYAPQIFDTLEHHSDIIPNYETLRFTRDAFHKAKILITLIAKLIASDKLVLDLAEFSATHGNSLQFNRRDMFYFPFAQISIDTENQRLLNSHSMNYIQIIQAMLSRISDNHDFTYMVKEIGLYTYARMVLVTEIPNFYNTKEVKNKRMRKYGIGNLSPTEYFILRKSLYNIYVVQRIPEKDSLIMFRFTNELDPNVVSEDEHPDLDYNIIDLIIESFGIRGTDWGDTDNDDISTSDFADSAITQMSLVSELSELFVMAIISAYRMTFIRWMPSEDEKDITDILLSYKYAHHTPELGKFIYVIIRFFYPILNEKFGIKHEYFEFNRNNFIDMKPGAFMSEESASVFTSILSDIETKGLLPEYGDAIVEFIGNEFSGFEICDINPESENSQSPYSSEYLIHNLILQRTYTNQLRDRIASLIGVDDYDMPYTYEYTVSDLPELFSEYDNDGKVKYRGKFALF